MIEVLRQRRFGVLLATLLLVAVLYPSLGRINGGALVLDIYFSIVMVTVTAAVADRHGVRLISIMLIVPTIGATWTSFATDIKAIQLAAIIMQFFFFGFSGLVVLTHVLRSERVTADKICGVICVYLILGICWGLLYSTIETIRPDSFLVEIVLEDTGARSARLYSTMSYYSFVTLSTLGYGDVTPLTAPARTFSWLEAVTGQIYLTVVVARLVGLHIAHRNEGSAAEGSHQA